MACVEASDLGYFLFWLSCQIVAEKKLVPEPEATYSAVRYQFLAFSMCPCKPHWAHLGGTFDDQFFKLMDSEVGRENV